MRRAELLAHVCCGAIHTQPRGSTPEQKARAAMDALEQAEAYLSNPEGEKP